jgi:hypothetical protein
LDSSIIDTQDFTDFEYDGENKPTLKKLRKRKIKDTKINKIVRSGEP